MAKRAVFVGDTHVGGRTTVAPPTSRGMDVPLTRDQKRLFAFWERMCDEVKGADVVVCNGDLVEGLDRHANGKGCWTTDMLEQCECATELLKMMKGKAYVGTMGSGYHAGSNPIYDEVITKALGGSFGPQQVINLDGNRCHVMHKIGYSKERVNRAGPIYSEIISALLREKELGQFKMIVRSHAHYFVQVEYRGIVGINLPGWKFHDDFLDSRYINDCPDIGYVVADFKGSNLSLSHSLMKYDGKEMLREIEI